MELCDTAKAETDLYDPEEDYDHTCGLDKGHDGPHKCFCGEEW